MESICWIHNKKSQYYLLSNNQDFLRSEEHEWEYKTPVEVSFAVQRPEWYRMSQ